MTASCLLSARMGDVIQYRGGRRYEDEVVDRCYIDPINEFPGGFYPVVDRLLRRLVHPQYYTVTKISKAPYVGISS